MTKLILTLTLAFSLSAFAQEGAKKEMKGDGPCAQIKKACEGAGFIPNTAKDGTGLWVDCVEPIIQGKPQPKKAKMALPTVDAATVAACKAKHPNFGAGKKEEHKKAQ